MKELDYAPLTEPVTKEERKAFEKNGMSKDYRMMFIIFLLTGVLVGPLVVSTADDGYRLITALIFIPIYFGISIAFVIGAKREAEFRAKLAKFAAKNNLEFIHDVRNPTDDGMIFNHGHSRSLQLGFRSKDNHQIELGNYLYVTGSGKNSQTHNYGFISMRLTRRLPHMVLDAKRNNIWNFSNLPTSFDKNQTLELEGDFNNYFTLYAPKQYERDALYVFTPDVMQHLIQYGQEFDMEVIDDRLFLYSTQHFSLGDPSVLKRLFGVISTIGNEIDSQSDYYADANVGDRSVNLVAPKGARLKTRFNWVVFGVIALFVPLWIGQIIPPNEALRWVMVLMMIVAIPIIIVGTYMYIRRQKT